MLTQYDFQVQTAAVINDDNYPTVAPLYAAQDPRLVAPLNAMAMMSALISAQLEVAAAEPFSLAKDATIVATAALRGIVNQAGSARIVVQVKNTSAAAITINGGSHLADTIGNDYHTVAAVTVPAATVVGQTLNPGSAYLTAVQETVVAFSHTITASLAFYKIPIPIQDGLYLVGLSVTDADGNVYAYRDRYVNNASGEYIYFIEADASQQLSVVFGLVDVVGVQFPQGQALHLSVRYCAGKITTERGTPLTVGSNSALDLSLYEISDAGTDPLAASTLRELCKCPAVSDGTAVFLGDFAYLVKRNFPDLKFLSVWNEVEDTQVRPFSLDNVNTLMVACYQADEQLVTETDPLADPMTATVLADTDLTATQQAIQALLNQADDSYRVRFLSPVVAPISILIAATISTSYVPGDVGNRIKALIFAEFGQDSSAAKNKVRPTERRIHELLRQNLPEIADRRAELSVTIPPYANDARPELYRYVSVASLVVGVSTVNQKIPLWGG
jgi:hypothetical protein